METLAKRKIRWKTERQEMIEGMVWLASGSGHGYGICRVGAMDIWNNQRPSADNPDWKSIVFVKGPAKKYTNAEIKKLYRFSKEETAKYDKIFQVRMGANAIIIGKMNFDRDRIEWLRKRMSWTYGPMYSPTLDAAMAVFKKEGV